MARTHAARVPSYLLWSTDCSEREERVGPTAQAVVLANFNLVLHLNGLEIDLSSG